MKPWLPHQSLVTMIDFKKWSNYGYTIIQEANLRLYVRTGSHAVDSDAQGVEVTRIWGVARIFRGGSSSE